MSFDIDAFIDNFYGEGGELSKLMEQFEYREGQVQMCHDVAGILANSGILIVEAGTGIGKTMAYLIPAMLIDDRVIISTGTKTLQEQIYFKDIPFLRKAGFNKVSYCYMKGRNNYLCLRKFNEFRVDGLLPVYDEVKYWPEIEQWAESTARGDRSEMSHVPENLLLWREICCDAENCLGRKCGYFEECFLFRMRKVAENSQIVIVNHHLFFADLYLKIMGKGTLIPEFSRIIFDEAHMLEEIAMDYFSINAAVWQLHAINKDIERKMYKMHEELDAQSKSLITSRFGDALLSNDQFFHSFLINTEHKFALHDEVLSAERITQSGSLIKSVEKVIEYMKEPGITDEEWQTQINRLSGLNQNLSFIMKRGDENYVYWGEMQEKGTAVLNATPIEIATTLQANLWNQVATAILTSATLSSQGGFDFIKSRLGISGNIEVIYKSPFNYQQQSILFIPRKISEPSRTTFADDVAEIVDHLVGISKGRAFILFTSIANMKRVHALLKDRLTYPVLLQGEKPKTRLIEDFREKGNAVLFATNSFWQGVDVVGEALSCVIIDKLPFSVPSDPVMEARLDRIRNEGQNPFYSYQLPQAILILKQGLGRLIRSTRDRGIMALLDKRVYEKEYGKYVLASLDGMNVTSDIMQVKKKMEK